MLLISIGYNNMDYEDNTELNEQAVKKMEELFEYLSKNTETPWEGVVVAAGVIFEICELAEWDFEEVVDKLKEAYIVGQKISQGESS